MASSSGSSRHQVTITLGRSASSPLFSSPQVVKRRAISDTINDDEVQFSGKKRPLRERLGSNVTDSDFHGSRHRSKRQQTESSSPHEDDDTDRQVGKDDLRLKLMRKGLLQRGNGGTEQNGVDLREKLSRNHKNSLRYDARGHAPEPRARLCNPSLMLVLVMAFLYSILQTEVQQTVPGLLDSLGLEKYLVLFQAEEVDMAALKQMGESDLKDMGVPMVGGKWCCLLVYLPC
nr:unnamed protein product [Digitaria exilis]